MWHLLVERVAGQFRVGGGVDEPAIGVLDGFEGLPQKGGDGGKPSLSMWGGIRCRAIDIVSSSPSPWPVRLSPEWTIEPSLLRRW